MSHAPAEKTVPSYELEEAGYAAGYRRCLLSCGNLR